MIVNAIRKCGECQTLVEFARTEAGRAMPLDLGDYATTDTTANVAVHRDATGKLHARVLHEGDVPSDRESRRMPHFATCPPRVRAAAARRGEVEGVIPFPHGGQRGKGKTKAQERLW